MAMMDPNNNDTIRDELKVGAGTPGGMIREARERAELSLDYVASSVNLLKSQISALEENHLDCLPGAIFVRSYLRNIARVLALDEAQLLQAYQQLQQAMSSESVTAVDTPERIVCAKPVRPISLDGVRSARGHWGLVAAAVVVASLWGWQQRGQSSGKILSLMPDQTGGLAAVLPGGIDDVLAGNAETRLMDSVELLPASRPVATAANVSSVAPVTAQPLSADSKIITAEGDQLSLRFSADCWVEIKDRDNRVLVATLKHAHDKLQLDGRGPFRVLLGFAPGVEMAYNGTPVNIELSQGGRSARLIVGSS